ncbi:MAG: hypothetical protein LKF42_00705 [Streptococcaceae bacterium]|jgi:hypothetical protein|nr:hypothetical protein [Streptococcaceae bacterium]MCH4176252.1 hypothetical protein [Streptococcaceae bacterium]
MTKREDSRNLVFVQKSGTVKNMPKTLKLNRGNIKEPSLKEKYGESLWFKEWEKEILEQLSIKA